MKNLILLILIISTSFTASSQEYGWVDISANVPGDSILHDLSDVFFVNDNIGWITSSSHTNIYHTTDGGETFEVQTTQLECNAIHMLNENEGYAGGWSGFVYRTVDGGENWNFHGTTVSNLTDISFPPTGETGYCCGINGNIWSIHSTGVTKMTSNINGDLASISFPVNSQEGWVCGGSVIRHYASNTWNGDQDMPSGGYYAIHMTDNMNGWAAGDAGTIINTTDGHNWQTQHSQAYILTDLFFLNILEGWAVGSGGTILHTINGGTDWNLEAAGLDNDILRGVHFTSPTNGYVVGNNKTLLKYTQVSGIREEVAPLVFEVFPNPCSDKIQITNYKIQINAKLQTSNSKLEIIDISGRKVKSMELQGQENTIDVSDLPAGIYFIKLQMDDAAGIRKIVKK